jgi:2-polyprenyl-6-methoxyphenol hydroxylase-like FAD-dependent oxidoreductase
MRDREADVYPRGGERAVVVGGSMSGLVAARVLGDLFGRVTVVERDDLGGGPVPRRGVPQGRHPHVLLGRGSEVLEQLFPGITDDLVARGALLCDLQGDSRYYSDGRPLVRHRSGLMGVALSRPLLEDEVRRRVLSEPGVDLVAPAGVAELVGTARRVTGVRVAGAAGGLLEADLVVDATGRGSHTPTFLESVGLPRAAESTVEVGIGYTTWVLPRRPRDLDGVLLVVCAPSAALPRFGAAMPIEGDRWLVMAGGYRGDSAPADLAGFRAFAATLAGPELAELVTDRDPVDGPERCRFPRSARRRYERLRTFPEGLLVVGDAVSSFNPIYGQGMTVAAMEALVLRDAVAAGGPGLAQRFFRRAARLVDVAWDLAAGGDLVLPVVPGRRPLRARVINGYVTRVSAAATVDAVVGRTFIRVANLLDPPSALVRPSVVARVLAAQHLVPPRPAATPAAPGDVPGLTRGR